MKLVAVVHPKERTIDLPGEKPGKAANNKKDQLATATQKQKNVCVVTNVKDAMCVEKIVIEPSVLTVVPKLFPD